MDFYEFDIPAALNAHQLKSELNCDEVYIRDNKLIIGGDLTQAQAQAGLAAHKAIDDAAVQAAKKSALLAKLGITEDEARLLLS